MIRRLPIRIRLALAFAVVMAAVLAATGAFVYVRLSSSLQRAVDQGLRSRAGVVVVLVQQSDAALRQAKEPGTGGGFVQVIGPNGKIVDSTPGVPAEPLVPATAHGFSNRTVGDQPVRLYAVPVTAQGRRLVVVAGTSLDPRAEALADLERQLVIGGPVALLLASLAAYLLAGAALRPVERMGERAATISAARPGGRLPVPETDDEIARLGARLNEMLGRLESALERERMLVSNASHELRTPLSLMKTEIELALAEPRSAPALVDALRSAGEETDRLSQLTDDLLLLASADSGALPLRRSDVAARELLDAIATRFARRAADAGRRIDVEAPDDLRVLGDRLLLEQALTNLVENALRHGTGTVTLRARFGPVLEVEDEGPGFPPEFAARAFERFSRAERTRGAGVGLGLAIVAAIAAAHGGSVAADDRDGGGGRVTLRLDAA